MPEEPDIVKLARTLAPLERLVFGMVMVGHQVLQSIPMWADLIGSRGGSVDLSPMPPPYPPLPRAIFEVIEVGRAS
ncbi:MAG: hypothetical protein JRD89_05945 [Deltaproteobacteria bacterium]|nr:hypothetical protein [Deltaproteobacteria bacterium]